MSEAAHQETTRRAYDTVAEAYAALLPGLDAESALDTAMIDEFAARCLRQAAGPVADVGCGSGRLAAYLFRGGADVRGFDLSPAMVDVARRNHPQLPFEVATMHALPVGDATFAGVLAWYSLIHTPPSELGHVVAELARVLRPGGHLLVAFQAGAGQRVDRSHGYGHEVAFTNYRHDSERLCATLTAGGFDVRVRLLRAAEGQEPAPQAVVLATRSEDDGR